MVSPGTPPLLSSDSESVTGGDLADDFDARGILIVLVFSLSSISSS